MVTVSITVSPARFAKSSARTLVELTGFPTYSRDFGGVPMLSFCFIGKIGPECICRLDYLKTGFTPTSRGLIRCFSLRQLDPAKHLPLLLSRHYLNHTRC